MRGRKMKDKKVIFSGMQATGVPTIGNYIGAMRQWSKFEDEFTSLYCIVDLHSITIRQDPKKLQEQARKVLLLYMASGLDPSKNILYFQSHVPAHAELNWILACYTYMGELNRMTQFKEKSSLHADNINAGLFTYPILMAADILLYQTDYVPVGEDQTQHLELTRDVARRFNQIYGDIFTVPEGVFSETGARIMKLQDPTKKMSKSEKENINNSVFLLDDPAVARKKIMRAVTDSDTEIYYDEDKKPGVSNLLSIYSSLTNQSIQNALKDFEGKNYGFLKNATADLVAEHIEKLQEKIKVYEQEPAFIDTIIKNNALKATELAEKTLTMVKDSIGFPK